MKPNLTAIPQGTRTFLFEEAELKRRIEQEIYLRLKEKGFQEIVTPLLEYYDAAVVGLSDDGRNRVVRFAEEESGRSIALRADITSQVARSAATHLANQPLPLKLCYNGPVFRRTQKGKGEQYVLNQSGMEIIGDATPLADAEIIAAIMTIMDAVNLKSYTISLGHAGIIGSLIGKINPASVNGIKLALAKKDKAELEGLLKKSGADASVSGKIVELAGMFGKYEDFTHKWKDIERLCAGDAEAMSGLQNLKLFLGAVESSGFANDVGTLTIDFGEMRGFGYYTGIIMELFSDSGLALGAGGRYDNLVGRFGKNLPAVGFAFDVDKMMEAVMREHSGTELKELMAKLGK